MDLPMFSAGFVAFALWLYVVLDGFDLGVGSLLLMQPSAGLRDRMVDAILPTWDGNETWLIMAGVALLAAFPLAYGVLLPAFYLPVTMMLLSLGMRGVSFEFRYQTARCRWLWDRAFGTASVIAALMQGVIVGGLIQGVSVTNGQFSGSVYDTFTPFCLLTALAVLLAYVSLGAGWLHLKATNDLRPFAVRLLRRGLPLLVAVAMAVCALAAWIQPGIRSAWSVHYAILSAIGALFFVAAFVARRIAGASSDVAPFALTVGLVSVGVVGMAVSVFPDIVPFKLSIWQAASPATSQAFMLVGACVVTPIVLGYSAFAYRVFRGKTPDEGWQT